MLGMFMVLPVLTTYGMALQGASEALIGTAIGIYGFGAGDCSRSPSDCYLTVLAVSH